MPTERTILFVGRNMQAAARLFYDVMPLVSGDRRVQCCFTVDDSSEFGDGVPRFLAREQVAMVPWDDARDPRKFAGDVTISASANANLQLLPGRKLVMAHGAGHHKYRANAHGAEDVVSGLSPRQLMVDGELVPSAVALAGNEQRDRLERNCPAAKDAAVVTGDVCAERIHRSLPYRDWYRRAMGLHIGQKLVVVSSTWGGDSLLARCPDLAERLLSELPESDYRFTFVLHPNGWDRHGRPQIHGWLQKARRAGLIMIPPHEGWRAAVVAADVVIGDHGSVSFYAADADRPLMFATFSHTEVPEDSPASALNTAAPYLDTDAELGPQVERCMREHEMGRYRHITARALDRDGSAATRMREVLYRLLGLDVPEDAFEPGPVPPPETDGARASSLHIHPEVDDTGLRLWRFPVVGRRTATRTGFADRIAVVDVVEPDTRLWYSATVITWAQEELFPDEAAAWAADQLHRYAGAVVVAVRLADARVFVRHREHGAFEGHSRSRLEPAVVGAAIYHHAIRSGVPDELSFRDGSRFICVTLTRE